MNINHLPKITHHSLTLCCAFKMPVPAANGMNQKHAVFVVIKECGFQNLSFSQEWLSSSDLRMRKSLRQYRPLAAVTHNVLDGAGTVIVVVAAQVAFGDRRGLTIHADIEALDEGKDNGLPDLSALRMRKMLCQSRPLCTCALRLVLLSQNVRTLKKRATRPIQMLNLGLRTTDSRLISLSWSHQSVIEGSIIRQNP